MVPEPPYGPCWPEGPLKLLCRPMSWAPNPAETQTILPKLLAVTHTAHLITVQLHVIVDQPTDTRCTGVRC